ncbi:13504_t:CDS:2 [Acaulospora colombiana]|uniref:13504_t:CDS:1 n=1 Tax=Acaulospora colombiana TaxID=27376 RepID=A0ACA9N8J4_9GLOM|nr:13504_t:CDS:2 [Acaulospora colombiana]
MPLTSKGSFSQTPATNSSVPFTVLPAPFQTVLLISTTQLQEALRRVTEIDVDVRNSSANLTPITNITKQQKSEYSSIMADLIPLYAKINRLIPLYYIITKNSDTATRDFITMKYMIQRQFILLPEDRYFLRIEELQKHKKLLQELEKYECAVEKLQNSGGHASINIQFHTRGESPQNQIERDDTVNHKLSLPPLKCGAGTLAKFLSLVEGDSLDELTNRVGDLILPKKINNDQSVNYSLAKGGPNIQKTMPILLDR